MPKSKEFFSLLKEQGKINNPKFDELIEKLPDFEIDPEAQKAFEESFMTSIRAASHPDVVRTVRYQALMPINRDFDKIISSIAEYDKPTADVLESLKREVGGQREGDTYKRMETLSQSIGDLFKKIKGSPAGDEDLKKELQKKNQTIQEYADKLTNQEKAHLENLKSEKTNFEKALHDYKLDAELEKLSSKFTFAEAYEKARPDLVPNILSRLKSENKLQLDTKDGQPFIKVLDDKGELRFNGNSQVTIKELLEDRVKPYLKQSEGTTTPQSSSRTITTNGTQNPLKGRGQTTVVK